MVSVVILAFNRLKEVIITLDKLTLFASTFKFPMDIILVDNASVDNTSSEVLKRFSSVRVVTIQNNCGIAGWNEGFKIASQKYLLVLDDDSHIEYGLTEAIAYMEKHNDVGILALNVTSGPYLTDSWVWQDGNTWQHEQDILGFFGCGAIIKKAVYEKIGGFAEWLYVYGHEWEYGIRCLNAGYKIRYFQKSSIIHRASGVNRTARRARIYGTRNEMGIIYKYFETTNRWKYIIRMFFNNMKRVKHEGWLNAWYDIIGTAHFIKLRRRLPHTPVSPEVQVFYAENFINTFPVFRFITKRYNK